MVNTITERGFTASLREAILLSRSKLDEWVECEKARADALAASAAQQRDEAQAGIDLVAADLLALQLQGELTIEDKENLDDHLKNGEVKKGSKQALEQSLQRLNTEVDVLQNELREKQSRVQDLSLEHAHHKERAQEANRMKKEVEFSYKATVEDLTRGIVNYKYLGLDFKKAEDERLRFSFSELDPNDASRQFFFELEADSLWKIHVCEPPLAQELVEPLLDRLNEDDDMMPFVRGMRQLFVDLIV